MAKMIALAGPVKGTTLVLSEGETSLGRDLSSQILLEDISVSRQHCLIRFEEGLYKLVDLDSHNGIFVNDLPVKQRVLGHGDRVKVGNSLFLVLLSEEAGFPDSRTVQLDDSTLITKSAVSFRIDDAICSMARDLSVLMKVSMSLTLARDLNELQRELLKQIFEAIPCQHGAIVLIDSESPDDLLTFGLERNIDSASGVSISRTVVEQVLREGVALLINDAFSDASFTDAHSLQGKRAQAVICVPIVLLRRTLGAIYVDTSDPSIHFNKEQLQLLTAFANIAAAGLENARNIALLQGENQRLREDIAIEHSMIGESPRMTEVYQLIARVAPTNSTVLITGESGTGKELAARAIHQNSPRRDGPFVAVNCATLTETLLESELFGHEKGAFTGAIAQSKGKLEIAHGGTVFLDEVGEMNVGLQAKLLRVLQEREIFRIGGKNPIKLDIRVIAATNKDLRKAITDGMFREDLYFRLNVVPLVVPPLRERRDDIALLASYFLRKSIQTCKRRVTGISPNARRHMLSYDWPGNVRELENAIERAVVLGSTNEILSEDLPEVLVEEESVSMSTSSVTNYHEQVNAAKRQIILRAMERSGGSYGEAARLLDIHPNNLHRIIRSLNLRDQIRM